MPRKCNDHDLVIYSELKPIKGPALFVSPIPRFEPFVYKSKQNTLCIPIIINLSDLEALFKLFFEESTILMLVNATNKNADIKCTKYPQQKYARAWRPVNLNEILAYLGIVVFMGC